MRQEKVSADRAVVAVGKEQLHIFQSRLAKTLKVLFNVCCAMLILFVLNMIKASYGVSLYSGVNTLEAVLQFGQSNITLLFICSAVKAFVLSCVAVCVVFRASVYTGKTFSLVGTGAYSNRPKPALSDAVVTGNFFDYKLKVRFLS